MTVTADQDRSWPYRNRRGERRLEKMPKSESLRVAVAQPAGDLGHRVCLDEVPDGCECEDEGNSRPARPIHIATDGPCNKGRRNQQACHDGELLHV